MKKIGGLILLVSLGLTGCSTAGNEAAPAVSKPATFEPVPTVTPTPTTTAAPFLAAPVPTTALPPAFTDESTKAKYLDGVKNSLNAWRDGVRPSDETLLVGAAQACSLFAQGMTYTEIGALAGENDIQRTNGVAVAVYASRNFCTEYNTDNL
ncbi:hypothetical protein [Paenarthrobacter ureafaciens]|uniref:hypothetical protein n=1 Tax=Paenarthrobacter ureafaciens TaxID=37931 RepID=UPI001C2C7F8F|nr:hypothetical protein [Paenarthrobacter ureafaciens]UOD81979.1 hypothetical protein MQZ73_03575 [Paenarthrobacter ureafaciens]WNZ05471.1 hypothetical protein PVT25_08115 [Paenarthrobacter ureafaciens]